ncbi:ethanolamine ammonia-lyase subunit EutC [Bacillus sp. V5-8f]|uniref:ethanolamine ammonia-lyase subunit EutC n=1 Tax=Bacillus sp. V5-8f TaxID=2053044 RepID=UPI000C794F0B|nr:ethanolamine ammonia-lyase subunit EutC [Bacillus sp. V5-8f]PLT32693.1 ethanolamine ammonia-lyase [Bacillus sp. V5-8f]
MDEQLIEKITNMIVSKLSEKEEAVSHEVDVIPNAINNNEKMEKGNLPEFGRVLDGTGDERDELESEQDRIAECRLKEVEAVPEQWLEMRKKTPARIGVGRSGPRPRTNTWITFRYDHAAAVDTVSGEVRDFILKQLKLFSVTTLAADKEVYIRRPDYGRRLSEEAKRIIKEKCVYRPTVQIIVADGLSSKAIEENVEDVYLSLHQSLVSLGFGLGTSFYIERGRVAVMDEIGDLLEPEVVVLLIGERPGLVSAESLSAYLCYQPRIGTIEADRMVVSNIHKGGIPPVEAGAYLGIVVEKILRYKASGISLVQKEE